VSPQYDVASPSDPAAPVRSTIHRVFKILAYLPCDQGMAVLWAEARELREEIERWRRSPPSPNDRADVVRRVLSTHAHVAALAGVRRRVWAHGKPGISPEFRSKRNLGGRHRCRSSHHRVADAWFTGCLNIPFSTPPES
jgi:hypothetical protein